MLLRTTQWLRLSPYHVSLSRIRTCGSLSGSAQLLQLCVEEDGCLRFRPMFCDGAVGVHSSVSAAPLSPAAAVAALSLHSSTLSAAAPSAVALSPVCATAAAVSLPASKSSAEASQSSVAIAQGMHRGSVVRGIWQELSEEAKAREFGHVDSEQLLTKLNTLLLDYRAANPNAKQFILFDTKGGHAARHAQTIAKALGLVSAERKSGQIVSRAQWAYTPGALPSCSATTAVPQQQAPPYASSLPLTHTSSSPYSLHRDMLSPPPPFLTGIAGAGLPLVSRGAADTDRTAVLAAAAAALFLNASQTT